MKDSINKEFVLGIARCSSIAIAILISNLQGLQAIAGSWKPQELALMVQLDQLSRDPPCIHMGLPSKCFLPVYMGT